MGEYPHPLPMGGGVATPIQFQWGVPPSSPDRGVPHPVLMGVPPPSTRWGNFSYQPDWGTHPIGQMGVPQPISARIEYPQKGRMWVPPWRRMSVASPSGRMEVPHLGLEMVRVAPPLYGRTDIPKCKHYLPPHFVRGR